VLQIFLPDALNGASGFGNRFIPVNEYRGSGADFSNTPFDFLCPRFFNLSPGWRNESRKLMRETTSLPVGEPHRGSLDAFICDHHVSDPTSEIDVERLTRFHRLAQLLGRDVADERFVTG
jgi:hypothetical protein